MKVASTQLRAASVLNRVSAAANAALGARRYERPLAAHGGEIARARTRCVVRCSEDCARMLLRVGAVERSRSSSSEGSCPDRSQNRRLTQRSSQCVFVLSGNSTFRAVYATCSTTIGKETTAWQRRSRAAT
jgi:hypothetical protein